jgi:hypothetical protein
VKHQPVHLKLDPKRDVDTYHFKRRKVHVLRVEHGGLRMDAIPDALCGRTPVQRLVTYRERERVTCERCKRLMLVRFPKPPVNPRSGMAMPRPT